MNLLPHLIESTACITVIWLVTLLLRRNHARARHGLWMAASVKFLIPFSLLVSLGGHIGRHDPAPVPPQFRFVIADALPPVPYARATKASPVRGDWRPRVLWSLWLAGCSGILIRWCIRWRRATVRLRDSVLWEAARLPVPVRFCEPAIEPGVFGIFRPVLVLPAGIEHQLSAAQLQAVLAHELCHVRHRDNLAAAIHMIVEALFWFHPLVWWLGARLVEERERACDEEVLQQGSDRAVYAQSILRICQWCLESPLPCVSGITGAGLKQRIRAIMTPQACRQMETGKKLFLAGLAIAAVATPVGLGLTHPLSLRAQPPQTGPALQFDVASVKVSPQRFSVLTPERSGGRIRWTTDLWTMLGYAYRLEPWRISGPVPGRENIYAVDATTDASAGDDQVRLMFQSLLMDRFRMAVHRETKDADGYALTVAKTGLKIHAAKDEDPPAELPEYFRQQGVAPADLEGHVLATIQGQGFGALTGRRVTMRQVSDALQRVLRNAVLDQTGLTGKYYFALRFAQEEHPGDSDLPDIFVAIQELGLKLEKHRGPVEMLVIDRMEKTPTEN